MPRTISERPSAADGLREVDAMIWIAISIPVMVLGTAIAVVPVLWGTMRHHDHERANSTDRPQRHLLDSANVLEQKGVQALERRLEVLERALLEARHSNQMPAPSSAEN